MDPDSKSMSIKIQGPNGTKRFDLLQPEESFTSLYEMIANSFSVNVKEISLYKIHPSFKLEPSDDDPIGAYIESGETLILQGFFSVCKVFPYSLQRILPPPVHHPPSQKRPNFIFHPPFINLEIRRKRIF